MDNKKVFVDYENAKTKTIRDLELLVGDELTRKVNELNEIVDHIAQNWQGSNADRSKKEINDITEAISNFKRTCLDKNLHDISAQIDTYQQHEEVG